MMFVAMSVFLAVTGFVTGYRMPPHPMRQLTNEIVSTSGRLRLRSSATETLPAKYDLRNIDGKSYLTPVRNQGNYGTCWAHAPLVGIEYLIYRDEGICADLSENNLANMNGLAYDTWEIGSDLNTATAMFLSEIGPITEALDPYPSRGTSVRERGVRLPRKVIYVPARSVGNFANEDDRLNDLAVIKRALMKYGPLATSYYHSENYRRGAAYYNNGNTYPNHAISIVGWDDNYAASNFKYCPPGNGAFIIKNSWGEYMFDHGYLYISYYDRALAINQNPLIAYANLSKGDDYGRVYEYDRYGCISQTGYGCTSYAMNVFTARADERLAAFGFYALVPNIKYRATVVINPVVNGNTLTGENHSVAWGTKEEAGYGV